MTDLVYEIWRILFIFAWWLVVLAMSYLLYKKNKGEL